MTIKRLKGHWLVTRGNVTVFGKSIEVAARRARREGLISGDQWIALTRDRRSYHDRNGGGAA